MRVQIDVHDDLIGFRSSLPPLQMLEVCLNLEFCAFCETFMSHSSSVMSQQIGREHYFWKTLITLQELPVLEQQQILRILSTKRRSLPRISTQLK